MWLWSVFLEWQVCSAQACEHTVQGRLGSHFGWREGKEKMAKLTRREARRPAPKPGGVGGRGEGGWERELPSARVAGPGLRLPTPASGLWFRQAAVPISFPHLKCARAQQAPHRVPATFSLPCLRTSVPGFLELLLNPLNSCSDPIRAKLWRSLFSSIWAVFLFSKDAFSPTNRVRISAPFVWYTRNLGVVKLCFSRLQHSYTLLAFQTYFFRLYSSSQKWHIYPRFSCTAYWKVAKSRSKSSYHKKKNW